MEDNEVCRVEDLEVLVSIIKSSIEDSGYGVRYLDKRTGKNITYRRNNLISAKELGNKLFLEKELIY